MSANLLQAFPTQVLVGTLLPLLRAVLQTVMDETSTVYERPKEFFSQYDFIVGEWITVSSFNSFPLVFLATVLQYIVDKCVEEIFIYS